MKKSKRQLFHDTTFIDINIDSYPFALKIFHNFWECLFQIVNDLMSKIYSHSLHFNNTMNISTHRLNKLGIFFILQKKNYSTKSLKKPIIIIFKLFIHTTTSLVQLFSPMKHAHPGSSHRELMLAFFSNHYASLHKPLKHSWGLHHITRFLILLTSFCQPK